MCGHGIGKPPDVPQAPLLSGHDPMKLHWCELPQGNFGDDLNPWLWPRLLPDLADATGPEFVGIGTLLHRRLERESVDRIIFSTGAGYSRPPRLSQRNRFYAVRGPLTARACRLDADRAVTDGAALLRRAGLTGDPSGHAGFMANHRTLGGADWQQAAESAGLHWINPRWSVEQVCHELSRCSLLVTDALHGAIAADTLRVPWIPLHTYSFILQFKWQDWCASLDMEHAPVRMPLVWHGSLPPSHRVKHTLQRGIAMTGLGPEHWSRKPLIRSDHRGTEQLTTALRKAMRTRPRLSDVHVLDQRVDLLSERLSELARDCGLAAPEFDAIARDLPLHS